MTHQPRKVEIVLIEDDLSVRQLFIHLLDKEGYSVRDFRDGESFVAEIRTFLPDVVILDIGLPRMDGFQVLERCKAEHPLVPVVMLTGNESPDTIVRAMREGASEYLTKPVTPTRFLTTVRNFVGQRALADRVRELETRAEGEGYRGILGTSPAMQSVFSKMRSVASTDVSVLVRGESGSGKELIARALHDSGKRAPRPFVAINCAALPESLQESELFGHERGAFTGATGRRPGRFEQADRGTLFLDEVGELSPSLQAKLLRVLQERVFHRLGGSEEIRSDFRLIAATNRDLVADVQQERFREDLFYRIAVFDLLIPPLRERGGDVLLLAHSLARELGTQLRGEPSLILPQTEDVLKGYHWPGNVRELQNVLQHAIVVSPGREILPWAISFPRDVRGGSNPPRAVGPASPDAEISRGDGGLEALLAGMTLDEIERRVIDSAMRRLDGNRSRVADELGIARTTLYRKLERQ